MVTIVNCLAGKHVWLKGGLTGNSVIDVGFFLKELYFFMLNN